MNMIWYIGVLYPFPDKMMSSNFSGVRLSTGGDKVYIENPWYMEYDRVASKLRKEIEVELPMQCTRLVGRPKLIMAQSESKDRLFIHVKVEVKASEDDLNGMLRRKETETTTFSIIQLIKRD